MPYPGGAPAVNALLGGHVSSAVLNWSEIAEQWTAGNVRALATMASRRIDPLPDLPTVAESGYKDFETDVWFGLVAPAGTPQETVSQLIDWFGGALLLPKSNRSSPPRRSIRSRYAEAISPPTLAAKSLSIRELLRELNFKM